ncbi:uncharacterized protein EDB93DRAFT_1146090 [Suillus bovinus]|uniref:uncharacterized protein n=1 Tax=Suillus bovinus TaxID=48563 RepID=UPI001B8674D5|nr:uncharacterized protein EDB93DRAFT_1146090 [Suillus bovinus]KAG2147891.1 hypothetical protein EDB93DRAFT_1146090 [Suillus bovinus]
MAASIGFISSCSERSQNWTRLGSSHVSCGLIDSTQRIQNFDTNPIYAVLHESIYCTARHSEEKVRLMSDDVPIYFTGEMIFPDMFEDYHHLRPL